MRKSPVTFALISLTLALCTEASAAPAAPAPPKLRLPSHVRPVSYDASLRVVPSEERFSGEIHITVELERPSSVVWLNANELELQRAEARAGEKSFAAQVLRTPKDFVGLKFDSPLPKGQATLKLTYTGALSRKDSDGVFAQKEGNDWYVFTDLEPIDARRIFPSFDEPSFKVPWKLTLVVRKSDNAFSNTPELSRTDAGEGFQRIQFAQTKPLPTYLVSFAVGPFDVVEAGKSRVSGKPVRILTPKGMAHQARYAKEVTAELLARLEEYFGSSYPYEKLDSISVPLMGGAMENPGLITYVSSLILRKPEEESLSFQQAYASVGVHELAHQWFGNLVTTAWWDDLWLNEAFATWMTPKILEPWRPAWRQAETRVSMRGRAMGADSLMSARRIRQPIVTNDDMKNAFDAITYSKGASVLHMLESWLGPDLFQKGVQRYLRTHAHGTATAKDFLAAMSAEAKRDLTPVFSSFLDQAGVPLVTMKVRCDGKPRIELTQERYRPLGSPGSKEARAQTWQVPVCVRVGRGQLSEKVCQLVTTRRAQLALESCPDRLLPNADSAGYYRSHVEGPELTALFADGGTQLSLPERLGVLSDLQALVYAGKLPYREALALVPKLSRDSNRTVVQAAAGFVAGLRDAEYLPRELLPTYARFIREQFGERAKALGWTAKKGDDEDTLLLRKTLVPLVADQGEDEALQAEARTLATTWMAQRKGVDPEMLDSILAITARKGDAALQSAWAKAAREETDRLARRRILGALGAFANPAVAREGLKLTLDPALDARESLAVLWGALRSPETRPVAWSFVTSSFEPLVERLPRDQGASFPWFGANLCDEKKVPEVEAFFRERSRRFTGGPRQLAQALEAMRLCIAGKKAHAPSVTAFFESLPRE